MMGPTDIIDFPLKVGCQVAWKNVLNYAKNSVVFIGSKAAECLHWSGGTEQLLACKPLAVEEFNAYKYLQKNHTKASKALFILSESLANIEVQLFEILSSSNFESVTVVTAPFLDPVPTVQKLKQDIMQWMALNTRPNQEITKVEVMSFPFFIAPLTNTVFMMPPFSESFPILTPNQAGILIRAKANESVLPMNVKNAATSFAVSLNGLLQQLGVQDVLFSLGKCSNAVVDELEDLPAAQSRRKTARHKMSVVIVDRILDLFTPSSLGSSCVLDKLLASLSHLPQHSNDVAINMSPICQVTVDSIQEEALYFGCLSNDDEECEGIMEQILHKDERELLAEVHRCLKDSELTSKNVDCDALEKEILSFKGNHAKIQQHKALLQIALGLVQCINGERAKELNLVLSLEKVLQQNLIESFVGKEIQSLLSQVTKLISERHFMDLPLDALLALLVMLYSAVGVDGFFPLREEAQLQAAISAAMFEDQEYPGFVHTLLMPTESSKELADSVGAQIFTAIKGVSYARRDLTGYRSLFCEKENTYTPLIPRLLMDILNKSRPPIPDLCCRSTSLKDLLKSGFSMLLNKSQPASQQHPADQPNLMIVVIGGITGNEIRQLQTIWHHDAQRKGTLYISSTRLLSSLDTLEAVLKSTSEEQL